MNDGKNSGEGAKGAETPTPSPNIQVRGAELLQQLPCVMSQVYHVIEYYRGF